MSSLLCHSKVKAYSLSLAQAHRTGKFKRVSKEFLDRTEAHLKVWLHAEVHRHPSVGVTLK